MLLIHHLGKSQSERIVWLCEKLGISYALKHYARDAVTVHPSGAAPGETPYLAGETVTAADIMNVFTLSTMRYFYPVDLTPNPNIRAYLARIDARPAYQHAMEKGDPGMEKLLA